MTKTVTLNITSPSGEEKVEIPEALWKRFENLARERKTPVQELFLTAVDAFLKRRGY